MGSNLKITESIEKYIEEHSQSLHPVQKEIISYNESLGEIKKMQITVSQCYFLELIIKISNILLEYVLAKLIKLLSVIKNEKS